jgi:hypothetical protein
MLTTTGDVAESRPLPGREAASEVAHRLHEQRPQDLLLRGRHAGGHRRLHVVDAAVAFLDYSTPRCGEVRPSNPPVVRIVASTHKLSGFEGEQRLVHRLWRHERPTGELRVRKGRLASQDAENRVLTDGQVERRHSTLDTGANNSVKSRSDVRQGRFIAHWSILARSSPQFANQKQEVALSDECQVS